MGLLRARFRRHRYALHTHPTYVIALITDGCESVRVGHRKETAPATAVIVVNPEECHDGEAACDDGWGYRTFYPSVDLMAEVARELGRPLLPLFPRTVLTDPVLAEALARAHQTAEDGAKEASEAAMLLALRRLIVGHADDSRTAPAPTYAGSPYRVALYRHMIETDPAAHFALAQFALASGVTRFQVIRDFKQVTGLTPAAFLRDRRVRFAGLLIRNGETLANAAIGAGFADQSHLSRAFKASHGFTPGALRQACAQVTSTAPAAPTS